MEFIQNLTGSLFWAAALSLLFYGAAVSAVGFSLRRNTGLKWTLVILTFEGAVRVGLLLSLLATAWRRLG